MRVCIDCTPLLMRSAGVKTYLYHLTRELQQMRGGDVRAFPFLGKLPPLDHERSAVGSFGTLGRLSLVVAANHGWIPSRWILPEADIFHASNQMRRPPPAPRLTSTIHDLTSWLLPELHLASTRRADRDFAERILRRADGLIAVSHRSKQDAVETLGIPEDKLHVIYHGIADEFFEAGPVQASEAARGCGLARPYILFVSTIEPRKNLDRLLDAYEALEAGLREQYDLIVAGSAGWHSEATMRRLQEHRPGIRHLGYVPERRLPGLFAGATVFVYPSLYEGFGLPVVQAMAAGTAALISPCGALREIAGDAAVYADPRSTSEVASALRRLLLSASERERMSAAGRERAARFRWAECARQSWQFFERIGG